MSTTPSSTLIIGREWNFQRDGRKKLKALGSENRGKTIVDDSKTCLKKFGYNDFSLQRVDLVDLV